MKRYLALLAAVWLMLGFAWLYEAVATEPTVMYVHVREGTFLNGRREPNKQSPVLVRLWRGDTVEVVAAKNDWVQITGGEAGTAWCYAACLRSYPLDTDPILYTVASNGRVRVRKEPDGKTVRYVNNGDAVMVQFVIDGWAYIESGYIMTEFLERRENNE